MEPFSLGPPDNLGEAGHVHIVVAIAKGQAAGLVTGAREGMRGIVQGLCTLVVPDASIAVVPLGMRAAGFLAVQFQLQVRARDRILADWVLRLAGMRQGLSTE